MISKTPHRLVGEQHYGFDQPAFTFTDENRRPSRPQADLPCDLSTQQLLDAFPFQTAVLNDQGIILGVNVAWSKFNAANPPLYGRGAPGANYIEVCEQSFERGVSGSECVLQGLKQVLAQESKEFRAEYPCHTPEQRRWFAIRIATLGGSMQRAGEGPRRLMVIHEDITMRVVGEIDLHVARFAAAAAQRAKAEFLANISHEIRTPMTAILGFAELLRDNATDPDQIDAIDTIQRDGECLLAVIDDILDLSEYEAGKLDVERQACSPRQIVEDVVGLLRGRAESQGLSLQVEYRGQIPATIHTDPKRLRQILMNLVGNAVKFTHQGNVRVSVGLVAPPGASPKLKFEVTDTGIGMGPEQVSKLFQPFMQGDTSSTRTYGGVGLGLIVSQRLAEMLGGEITVRSTLGSGSSFTVTVETGALDLTRMHTYAPAIARVPQLRQQTPQADESAVPRSDAAQSVRNRRVLVSAQCVSVSWRLAFTLREVGADVVVAENDQHAVDLALAAQAEGRPFQLLIMEPHLLPSQGDVALRRLRSRGSKIPVLALMSSRSESPGRQALLAAGYDDCLAQSIAQRALIELVGRYCQE